MFGDHHVIEVRRILGEIPGVDRIQASSAFHLAEVTFDESQVNEGVIIKRLEQAGYLGELTLPSESGTPAYHTLEKPFFRHSSIYVNSREMVTFTQDVLNSGRPLWHCPGLGVMNGESAQHDVDQAK
jgi:copper chaperone CopZ